MGNRQLLSFRLLAIAGALSLTLLIFFSPRSVMDHRYSSMPPEHARVMLALSYIQDTKQPPMKGILMMRDVADKDPMNFAAVFYTAELAMKSGQFEKAEKRYRQLLANTSGMQARQAAEGLANALVMMGDTTGAREVISKYFENPADSLHLQPVNTK